jgi:hypothetical protein
VALFITDMTDKQYEQANRYAIYNIQGDLVG